MEIDMPSFEGTGTGVDAFAGMRTGKSAGRRDGRSPNEMRQLSLSHGVLTRADGSARIKLGGTDVLVAVYGPMECPLAKQLTEELHIHVSYRQREGIGGRSGSEGGLEKSGGSEATTARDIRLLVSEVVLGIRHPRKASVIAIQVLSDNGSVISAAVNATVMALIDSGMPMELVPTSACVSVNNGTLIVDPVKVEESEADAVITVCFDTAIAKDGFMAVHTHGDCGGEDLFSASIETCRQLANKTRAFILLCLQKKAEYPSVWSAS